MLRKQRIKPSLQDLQYDRLREACGHNADFVDCCRQNFSSSLGSATSTTEFLRWFGNEIAKRSVTYDQACQLRRVGLAIIMEHSDNWALENIIRWNEIDDLEDDTFFASVDLSEEIIAYVEPISNSKWIIEMTFGYRQFVSDLLIVFWETFCGRLRIDPATHLARNMDSAVAGKPIQPYVVDDMQNASQTEIFALFAKIFVFSHEIGHVASFKKGIKFTSQIEEEKYADNVGAERYLASALMLVPPFDRWNCLTVRERHEMMKKHPTLKHCVNINFFDRFADPDELTRLFRESDLFANDVVAKRAAFLNLMMWVVPILIFKMIGMLEHRMPGGNTHPPAADRIEAYWRRNPHEGQSIRKIVETNFAQTIERLFRPL
jgi:hypothetical protein